MITHRKGRLLAAALGGILVVAGTATPAMAADFRAVLNGDDLMPAGDTDGWGRVNIDLDAFDRLCADIEVRSIGEVTAVQVMRGEPGEGTPVVNLDTPDGDNDEDDCDRIGGELVDQIRANPAEFYVEVRTAEFPDGALRGKLAPSAS